MPPGTPQSIVIALNSVANAVSQLLNDLKSTTVKSTMTKSKSVQPTEYKLTWKDRRALSKAKQILADNQLKLNALRK